MVGIRDIAKYNTQGSPHLKELSEPNNGVEIENGEKAKLHQGVFLASINDAAGPVLTTEPGMGSMRPQGPLLISPLGTRTSSTAPLGNQGCPLSSVCCHSHSSRAS